MKFRINTPRIAFEQIEDETIVIDFDSGIYYSTGLIGSEALRQLARGVGAEEVIAFARRRYAGDGRIIEQGIRGFIEMLQRESIIMEAEAGAAIPAEPPPSSPAESPVFEPPVLAKYTDMQGLLLLDPIHEVDAEGWPVQKPDA